MRVALTGVLGLGLASSAAAQNSYYDQKFVRQVIDAINARTVEARAALVHPTSRSCITGDVGEWWRDSVARWAETPVPADPTWSMMPLCAKPETVQAIRAQKTKGSR